MTNSSWGVIFTRESVFKFLTVKKEIIGKIIIYLE